MPSPYDRLVFEAFVAGRFFDGVRVVLRASRASTAPPIARTRPASAIRGRQRPRATDRRSRERPRTPLRRPALRVRRHVTRRFRRAAHLTRHLVDTALSRRDRRPHGARDGIGGMLNELDERLRRQQGRAAAPVSLRDDPRQHLGRDLDAGLRVVDTNLFPRADDLRDLVERDVPPCPCVIELSVGVALDQVGHERRVTPRGSGSQRRA